MNNVNCSDHFKFNKKNILIFFFIVIVLVLGYIAFLAVTHLKTAKQVSEGNNRAFDISVLFEWSMNKFNNDVRKACNFENIQSITKSQEFQNVNHFLELDLPIAKQGEFIENVEVHPSNDLKACIITVYFKNNAGLSKDIAGKFITRNYFIQKEHSYCSTNIQNRRLVKGCKRV